MHMEVFCITTGTSTYVGVSETVHYRLHPFQFARQHIAWSLHDVITELYNVTLNVKYVQCISVILKNWLSDFIVRACVLISL